MNKNAKNDNSSFLLQGTILAAAGLIVRIIGLIYKIPMTRVLGDESIGYYNTAYEIYNVGLILSSYSLPLAVSKLIAQKQEQQRFRDSRTVFRCGIVLGLITGGLMTLILLIGADAIATTIFKSPGSALPLRVMTPTILVFAIMGVFRGYFQGHGNMIPTSISQIVEQIVNALVSVGASWYLVNRFANSPDQASWGAAGGTLGTLTGALSAFLFLSVLMVLRPEAKTTPTQTQPAASRQDTMKLLILTFTPIILSQFIYQLSGSVDNALFGTIMSGKGFSEKERAVLLGIYGGKYRLLSNVPVAIASSLGAAMIPSIAAARIAGRHEAVSQKIYICVKFNMLLAIPCAAGMAFLSAPLMHTIFGDNRALSAQLLTIGAPAVVFFSLSTVTNSVLQGIDLMKKTVTHCAISLAIHAVLVWVMLKHLNWGVYGLVIGNVTFALVVCVLNWISLEHAQGYHQEIRTTFVLPVICSLIMGAVSWAIYTGLFHLVHSTILSLTVAVIAAMAIYAVLILVTHSVTDEELRQMPMGTGLLRLKKRFLH